VHDRTPVCGAARQCAQINTDRANGGCDAAFDAADELAASMQPGRVAVCIGGVVMNSMILMLAMTAATIATGAVARGQAPTATISAHAAAYRPPVRRSDKVMLEAPPAP
jgi:hypothetical protein